MTAELWANDNGTARRIHQVWANDNGTARRINEIWVNDNGTARKIYAGDVITIGVTSATAITVAPTNAAAQYQLTAAGDIRSTINGGGNTVFDTGDWISPQVNMASYEARVTVTSGSLSSGTTGAWQSLATTRTWTKTAVPGVGLQTCVFTLEIRRASDAQVMASASITMQAESSV